MADPTQIDDTLATLLTWLHEHRNAYPWETPDLLPKLHALALVVADMRLLARAAGTRPTSDWERTARDAHRMIDRIKVELEAWQVRAREALATAREACDQRDIARAHAERLGIALAEAQTHRDQFAAEVANLKLIAEATETETAIKIARWLDAEADRRMLRVVGEGYTAKRERAEEQQITLAGAADDVRNGAWKETT